MKKTFAILVFILFVAAGLRLYKLGEVPISPDWDEAALGYNAYSILKTGRDEYGNFLPLTIRSFDDYKPPLYVYLTVPSVAFFGLSVWATRLPSAVMGILAVAGVYFLVGELFRKDPRRNALSAVTSMLLALSPWHIQFSRVAFETNLGVTLNIWGVTLFLFGMRNRKFFPLSAFLFGLGLFAYHSERVFVPLLVILLFWTFRKTLFVKNNIALLTCSFVVGLVFVSALGFQLFGQNGLLRLKATSTFSEQTNLLARTIKQLDRDYQSHDLLGLLLDNRRFVYAKTIVAGYLAHFSPRWLFVTGDNPRHHAPDMGLLYIWELPFLLFGLYALSRYPSRSVRIVVFGWLLLAPIPAAPTTGLPHAVRTLVFLPSFQILTALGIVTSFSMMRSTHILKFFYALCVVFNIAYYLNMYFVHQNPEHSEYWQYGYERAVGLAESVKGNYEKVIVSTQLEQSYMFFLFYTGYDPVKYIAAGGTHSGSFEEYRNSFDRYEFREIDWRNEIRDGSILYIGAPGDMPHGNVGNITFLNGKPAIELADRPNGAQ